MKKKINKIDVDNIYLKIKLHDAQGIFLWEGLNGKKGQLWEGQEAHGRLLDQLVMRCCSGNVNRLESEYKEEVV